MADTAGAPGAFDEAQVRALLSGGEAEIGRALALIERHFRIRVCRRLGRRFPGLSAEDVEDAWAETLSAALRAAREGEFQGQGAGPLEAWLYRVARARAVDHTRRRDAHEQAMTALRETLPSAQRDADERMGEAADLLEGVLATLPSRQRAVLRAFIDGFPETADTEALRRAVSLQTGSEESAAAVKRALQEARRKARDWLLREGTSRRAG